ncbi:MAG TPA: LLM class flavin-dependent oxidoreductase [Allosphingosinicella sp.]|jgi:alkanal monooxygenase alpha chain
MEWGIYLITAQAPILTAEEAIQNSVFFAQEAERLGYSHAWVLEHHFTRYGLVGSALMHASFILGKTSRLKVGTAIQVLPLHHPVQVAEQVALIDQLSQGRLMLGVGRGTFRKDFEVFGADMGSSRQMTAESLDIIKSLWIDGKAEGKGPFFKFPEIEIYPEVYTKPHPPLYTVAISPESIAWAAGLGIPLILGFSHNDEEKAVILEQYGSHAEDAGFDPGEIPHVVSCIAGVSRDGDQIKRASWDHILWWMDEGYQATQLYAPGATTVPSYEWRQREHEQRVLKGIRTAVDILPDEMAKNPIGSPQECIDKLCATVEATGITRFALGFEAAGKREAVMESMELFTSEVIPHVR